jgi:hypothetical protein
MTSSMRVVLLVTMPVLASCGSPPESTSMSAWIYEDGAVVEVRGSAEPVDAVIDAEWSITIENRDDEPCAVGVYAWVGDAYLADFRIDRPNASTVEEWPSSWQGAPLLDSGVVEGTGALVLGGEPIHEPAKNVFARYVITTCPGAQLIMDVQIDAVVEYPQPWTSDREMNISVRQLN